MQYVTKSAKIIRAYAKKIAPLCCHNLRLDFQNYSTCAEIHGESSLAYSVFEN